MVDGDGVCDAPGVTAGVGLGIRVGAGVDWLATGVGFGLGCPLGRGLALDGGVGFGALEDGPGPVDADGRADPVAGVGPTATVVPLGSGDDDAGGDEAPADGDGEPLGLAIGTEGLLEACGLVDATAPAVPLAPGRPAIRSPFRCVTPVKASATATRHRFRAPSATARRMRCDGDTAIRALPQPVRRCGRPPQMVPVERLETGLRRIPVRRAYATS